jgi:hypothetical protein
VRDASQYLLLCAKRGHGHPDRDTIAAFRKRFLGHMEPLFVELLKVARATGMLKLETVPLKRRSPTAWRPPTEIFQGEPGSSSGAAQVH